MANYTQIDKALAWTLLPARNPMGHKGTFGRVYVYGGAVGYTGAPAYAGEAAFRCGCGLVFVGVPESVYPIVAAQCQGPMVKPVPDNTAALLADMHRCDAAVIGPGLGREPAVQRQTLALLENLPLPIVLDADGINAAAAHIHVLTGRRFPTVVTPHEGEFARLGGSGTLNRGAGAAALADTLGAVVVRKGPGTVIAAPDGRVWQNTTGNDALAKGGSGDVLAGMIGSFLAQGVEPFRAAALGVWLHGLAGDIGAKRLTAYAAVPQDIIRFLPDAFAELLSP